LVRKENKTFSGSILCNLNATVGPNGSDAPEGEARSNIDYAVGFSSAALSLIDVAIQSKDLKNSPDYLVYPICFNMRHSLELYLKRFWSGLDELSRYRIIKLENFRDDICSGKTQEPLLEKNIKTICKGSAKYFNKGILKPFPHLNLAAIHDVSTLWDFICVYSPLIDSRFKCYIDLISEFVIDIAEIDPTGQTFRYPSSNESEMHLKNTPLINIEILKIRFSFLSDILYSLSNLFSKLTYEYRWVNFTSNLSYFNLYEISMCLSSYNAGDTCCYKAAEEKVINSYGISKKEYYQSIELLKSDRVLSQPFIDNQSLVHLEISDIINYVEIYFQGGNARIFEIRDDDDLLLAEAINHEDLIQGVIINSECINKIYKKFNLEKLAELHALYYFAREAPYHNIYLSYINENLMTLKRSSEVLSEIDFYFSKSNLVENLISSLWVLNCKTYASDIIKSFNLDKKTFWLEIKNGTKHSPFREVTSFENEIREAKLRLSIDTNAVRSVMLSSHNI